MNDVFSKKIVFLSLVLFFLFLKISSSSSESLISFAGIEDSDCRRDERALRLLRCQSPSRIRQKEIDCLLLKLKAKRDEV